MEIGVYRLFLFRDCGFFSLKKSLYLLGVGHKLVALLDQLSPVCVVVAVRASELFLNPLVERFLNLLRVRFMKSRIV